MAWWWRPPAFLMGLAALVALLYVGGSQVYLPDEVRDDRKALEEMQHRHALLVGASHGHDLILDEAGMDGVDMTHGGQDLYEMAYIARSVMRRAPLLDSVFIALSYFSFSFDNAAYVAKGVQTRIGRRIRVYSSFPRPAFYSGDAPQFLKAQLWPIVTADHYRAAFRRLPQRLAAAAATETDEDTDSEEAAAPAPAKKRRKRKPPGFYQNHARGRCRQYSHLMRVMRKNHPNVVEDTKELMLELTRELESASIRVIFFTPPYLRAYTDCFEQRYQQLTRDTGRYLERATHARYFDLSRVPEFVDRQTYFTDSDHLNVYGKVEFSHRLAARLAQRPER